MLMKTGILYVTTCFHRFGILRHVDPFVRMLHIYLFIHFLKKLSIYLYYVHLYSIAADNVYDILKEVQLGKAPI